MDNTLLRVQQMAVQSGLAEDYLMGRIEAGEIPAVSVRGSRVVLVRRADFEAWLQPKLEPLPHAAERAAVRRALANV